MNRKLDVLICGYYGFGNLGDELIALAVVRLLENSGINKSRIGILSANPKETEKQLEICAYDRWSIRKIFGAMKNTRTLLLGGGGLFQDFTSVRSCFYYWGIVKIARFCGVTIWAAGQSIGPIKSSVASLLAKNAFSSCVCRIVRNTSSLGMLNNWGLIGTLAPDLVMSIKVKRNFIRGETLLLNLRGGYEQMSKMAAISALNIAEEKHLKITGIAFCKEDESELNKYCNSGFLKLEQITIVKNLEEFENIILNSGYAIGMRLHFLVLCILAGIPVRGVPYDPKVSSLCQEWGIPSANIAGYVFSDPPDEEVIDEAAAKVVSSFKQGLIVALGETDGKR